MQRPVQTCPGPIHPNGSLLRASAQSPRAMLASIFRRSRTGAVPDSNCCLGLSPALCIPPPDPRPTGHVPLRAASSPTGLFHGCAIPGRGATRASLSRGRGANCSAAHATSRRHTRVVRHARHARSPSGMWGRAPETAPHTYTPVTSAAQSYKKCPNRWGPPTHTNAHRTAYNATRRVALYYTHTHSSTPQQPPPSTCPN